MSGRRLGFALVIVLLMQACFAHAQASPVPQGYKEAAANDAWTLYVSEANLGLLMRDNATGNMMASTVMNPDDFRDNALWKGFYQSGIVLEYIEGTINKYPWANLVSTENTKSFTYLTNGFDCEVHYPQLGIAYTAQIRLDANCLSVSIPQPLIREEKEAEFAVGSFYVYPFMGYSHMGGNGGYILIPDGQGAIIDLKDNEGRYSSPYVAQIYGENVGLTNLAQSAMLGDYSTNNPPENAVMPVFGIRHTDTELGFAAVIHKGDASASVQAYFNGVGNMSFDWACFKYTYRVVYAQSTGPTSGTVNMRTPRAKNFDIEQRFYFLSGADADYAGMARAYRGYLEEQGAFQNADKSMPFGVQADFLGGERMNGLLGTMPVTMTTAAQAGDILADMKERGVAHSLSALRGWGDMGLTGGNPTRNWRPAGFLGGKNGFSALFERAGELGYRVLVEANVLEMIPKTAGTLTYSALKKVDSNTFITPLFGWVYDDMQYLAPHKSLEMAQDLAKQLDEGKVPGALLSGFPSLVTDYVYRQRYYDSAETSAYYAQAAEAFSGRMPTALHRANAYLWRYATALTGLPVGGSDYVFTSRDVPFLAIALSGKMPAYAEYANFQANTRQFFLKLAEQGLRPAFLLTHEDPMSLQETNANYVYSSEYELYADMIAQWNARLSVLHGAIGGASIVSHSRSGDLVTVGYDNGAAVLINFSENDVAAGGITVPALDFEVVNALD